MSSHVKGRMLAEREWPPPGRLETITTHREGGWIATGECGRPHLVGGGWAWWRCPNCARIQAERGLRDRRERMLALYYPTGRYPR